MEEKTRERLREPQRTVKIETDKKGGGEDKENKLTRMKIKHLR